MAIIYLPDGTIKAKPDHEKRENGLQSYFPGQKSGEMGASKLNPLLYSEG